MQLQATATLTALTGSVASIWSATIAWHTASRATKPPYANNSNRTQPRASTDGVGTAHTSEAPTITNAKLPSYLVYHGMRKTESKKWKRDTREGASCRAAKTVRMSRVRRRVGRIWPSRCCWAERRVTRGSAAEGRGRPRHGRTHESMEVLILAPRRHMTLSACPLSAIDSSLCWTTILTTWLATSATASASRCSSPRCCPTQSACGRPASGCSGRYSQHHSRRQA